MSHFDHNLPGAIMYFEKGQLSLDKGQKRDIELKLFFHEKNTVYNNSVTLLEYNTLGQVSFLR